MEPGVTLLNMRRLFAVVSVIAIVTLAFAAPAWAQRDPFDPLIEEGSGATVTTGTAPDVQPAPEAPVSGEGLANTGADISGWVALGYTLVAAGAGAVALTGVLRKPATVTPRR
jgi:hypothetical protein